MLSAAARSDFASDPLVADRDRILDRVLCLSQVLGLNKPVNLQKKMRQQLGRVKQHLQVAQAAGIIPSLAGQLHRSLPLTLQTEEQRL